MNRIKIIKCGLLIMASIFSSTSNAAELVYGTDSPKGADVWIYISDSGKGADEWWIVTDKIDAADIVITDNPQGTLPWYYITDSPKGADKWVAITKDIKAADKCVFVENQSLKKYYSLINRLLITTGSTRNPQQREPGEPERSHSSDISYRADHIVWKDVDIGSTSTKVSKIMSSFCITSLSGEICRSAE